MIAKAVLRSSGEPLWEAWRALALSRAFASPNRALADHIRLLVAVIAGSSPALAALPTRRPTGAKTVNANLRNASRAGESGCA
jgi:hypothetical protein